MLLEIKSLTKIFGGLVAVDDFDMEIEAGSIVGIAGPNGAGKTTLFNLISGQLGPTSGRVLFEGKNIAGKKPHTIAHMGIGRTFQTTALFSQLPVKFNLAIAYRMRTRSGFWDSLLYLPRESRAQKELALKVAETMAFVGITEYLDSTAGSIPQIAQKRLAIGMALIGKPRLMLLDEPTGGIGSGDVSGLIELIEKIRDLGVAVCIIEHKMRVIMGLADRMVVLNFGRKIGEGTPREVSRNPEVIQAYLGSGYHA